MKLNSLYGKTPAFVGGRFETAPVNALVLLDSVSFYPKRDVTSAYPYRFA